MEDLNDKILGGNLSAPEWNQVPSEIQNVIEKTGQSLTNSDIDQLGKGIANYVGNSNFYVDSGIENSYVLTSIGSNQPITDYTVGLTVEFIPTNTNTDASVVNVSSLGDKVILGTTSVANQIVAGVRTVLKYDGADFVIVSGTSQIVQTVQFQTGAGLFANTGEFDRSLVPQKGDGNQFMSLGITPVNAANLLEISVVWNGTARDSLGVIVALFDDSIMDALATVYSDPGANFSHQTIFLTHTVVAGQTSLITFLVEAATSDEQTTDLSIYFNGRPDNPTATDGVVRFGGTMASSITIKEISPLRYTLT